MPTNVHMGQQNVMGGGGGGGKRKKTGFEIISCCTVCRAKSLTQFWRHRCVLTPSLPQSVKFPGWKMHGRACKECIFQSYSTSASNAVHFDENPFTYQVKRRQKGSRVSNFALLLVVFKWHHGSEGVKKTTPPPPPPQQPKKPQLHPNISSGSHFTNLHTCILQALEQLML